MQSEMNLEEERPKTYDDNDLELCCAIERLEIALQGIMRINEKRFFTEEPYAAVSVSDAIEAAFSTFQKEISDFRTIQVELREKEDKKMMSSPKPAQIIGLDEAFPTGKNSFDDDELNQNLQIMDVCIEGAMKVIDEHPAKGISSGLSFAWERLKESMAGLTEAKKI